MAQYLPTAENVWMGRVDGDEDDVLRWHQVIQVVNLNSGLLPLVNEHQQGIALVGFCSDEGVKRNGGRAGAAEAPGAIRKSCCNLPLVASHIVMVDAGDVICNDSDLEAAQQLLGKKINVIRSANYLPIVIGGGHEVAYANFSGIIPLKPKQQFGIINFDAHFDLREPVNAKATSGTGIRQMKLYCDEQHHAMHYLAIGIQQYANTKRLFNEAVKMDALYFLAENFCDDQLEHIINALNGIMANADVLQLTIDMDVFSSAYAPGVSAGSFNGIQPNTMFKRLLRHIVLSGKLASVDIAETNPMYDIDNSTARLASSVIFDIVQAADINVDW